MRFARTFFILLTVTSFYLSEKGFAREIDHHQCDAFFCECTPLLRGLVTTATLSTSVNSTTIPVPIVSATGYGEGIRLGDFPLLNSPCCGFVVADAGRVDITKCGWYRIGFYGEITVNSLGASLNSNPITLVLHSSLLGDIVLANIDPNFDPNALNKLRINKTIFAQIRDIPACGHMPVFYTLSLNNVPPNSSFQFAPSTNSRVIFQRMGPCEHCKKEKCCCPCSSSKDSSEECHCHKKDHCSSFFCECMPLFEGLVSNFPFSFFIASETSGSNSTTIPINAENNGSVSSGRIASVCKKPLFVCNRQIIPGGKIIFCKRCGWAKITIDGDFRVGAAIEPGFSAPVTLTLKSIDPCIPDINLGTYPQGGATPTITHFYTEEVVNLNNCNDSNCPAGYYLMATATILNGTDIQIFGSFLNTTIMIEADGPCGCCPKTNNER